MKKKKNKKIENHSQYNRLEYMVSLVIVTKIPKTQIRQGFQRNLQCSTVLL
jgi:hypothetical protein